MKGFLSAQTFDSRTPFWLDQGLDGRHTLQDATPKNVRTDMSLHFLAYNTQHKIKVMRVRHMLAAIPAGWVQTLSA